MSSDFRLYLMCRRADALVASQLGPEEFGGYMATGVDNKTSGRAIFLEVDPARVPGGYFDMDRARRETSLRADGLPKRSKYVSIYRSMEHVPMEAFGRLFLVTRDGRTLGIEGEAYRESAEGEAPNMFLELCPTFPLVVSSRGPRAFVESLTGKTATGEPTGLRVPRLLFADMRIDREEGGGLSTTLPYKDPDHILQCLNEVMEEGGRKVSKVVDRTPQLASFYRCVRRGFFLGDAEGMRFYPYPSREAFEERHHWWWRSASLGD